LKFHCLSARSWFQKLDTRQKAVAIFMWNFPSLISHFGVDFIFLIVNTGDSV
jgi:hypothetical protein